MLLAPITLFVYKRPWHTKKTVEALSNNALAENSELYIFSDGPKNDLDRKSVDKVRAYLKTIKGFKKVEITERSRNMGLADSIVGGITETVNKFGKVIVLEDDIVTSKGFLKYMNNALDLYKNEKRVMHVSGYMFPVKEKLPDTFFYNTASCWGWGTWKRAWDKFNPDSTFLVTQIDSLKLKSRFNVENSYNFYNQLKQNAQGKLKTWAVKWYASIFLNNGYVLHPYPSLTNNIGHDGSGSNCGYSDTYTWKRLAQNIKVEQIPIIESAKARKIMRSYNRYSSKLSYIQSLRNFLKNKLYV